MSLTKRLTSQYLKKKIFKKNCIILKKNTIHYLNKCRKLKSCSVFFFNPARFLNLKNFSLKISASIR